MVASTEPPAAAAPEPRVERSEREARDREAPMGRGTRDTAGRMLAATGHLTEMRPQFAEPLSVVAGGGRAGRAADAAQGGASGPRAGVPVAAQGILRFDHGSAVPGLPHPGPVCAIRRRCGIRRPANGAPSWAWDRCPEVKTLRGKIKALGQDVQRVRDWQASLAAGWMAEKPDVCATLSVDGHVKVYSGRKGKLPKHHVARQKLCLPASTSYWINALGGKPFPVPEQGAGSDHDPRAGEGHPARAGETGHAGPGCTGPHRPGRRRARPDAGLRPRKAGAPPCSGASPGAVLL